MEIKYLAYLWLFKQVIFDRIKKGQLIITSADKQKMK